MSLSYTLRSVELEDKWEVTTGNTTNTHWSFSFRYTVKPLNFVGHLISFILWVHKKLRKWNTNENINENLTRPKTLF